MEADRNKELLREGAKLLFNQISGLCFSPQEQSLIDFLNDPRHIVITYNAKHVDKTFDSLGHPDAQNVFINLIRSRADYGVFNSFTPSTLPADFQLPAYSVSKTYGTVGENNLYTTKYGRLPREVADLTGKVFKISTKYYLNQEGVALKHEEIKDWWGKATEQINEVLSGDNSRFVEWDIEDYEYVGGLVTEMRQGLIENGMYTSYLRVTR